MYTVDEITAIGKKVLLLVKAYVTLYLGSTEQELNDGSQSEDCKWTPFKGNSKADVQRKQKKHPNNYNEE